MATELLVEHVSSTDSATEPGPAISASRTEVVAKLAKREAMLHAVSVAVSQLAAVPWHAGLPATLSALGEAIEASRVWVVEHHADASSTVYAEWQTPLSAAPSGAWNLAEWSALNAKEPTIRLNKDDSDAAQAFLTARGAFSCAAAPIRVENEVWGTLGWEDCSEPRVWDESEIEVLQVLAGVLGATIAREKSAALLHASDIELHALFGAMDDAIFVLDREGRYLKVVSNHPPLLARPADQLIGRTTQEVLSDDMAREFVSVISDVLNTQSPRTLEYPLELEGAPHWFSASVTPFGEDKVLWVARNVTPARQAREMLRESEALFRLLAENSTDKIARMSLNGFFLYVSPSVKPLLGYAPEELVGTTAFDLIYPEDWPIVAASFEHLQRQPGLADTIIYRMRCKSGEFIWFETTSRIVGGQDGEDGEIHAVSRDISDRRRAEIALREAEAKYRSIFENAVEGIFRSTPEGRYLDVNPSLARIYGYDSPAELQRELLDISHQLYLNPRRRLDFIAEMAENGSVSNFEAEIRRKDGRIIWISENARAVRDAAGALLYYEGTVEDITARKTAEEQLLHDALHDKLTGLSNRALFMDRLGQAFARLKRHPEAPFATLFLDFDRFKSVNDSLGHMAGDELLIAVSRRIADCLRPGDTVSRLGGDEFAILLEDIADVAGAILVAERIQSAMGAPLGIVGQEIFTSASIGIAMGHSDYQHPEELLRDADMAMYRAKALGKARHHVFDVGMHERAVALLQLETDLRHAIEREEFRVHYQPIIDLESGEISGFEALVRWQHPTRGLVSPTDFIPIAEETGWIVPIGRYVLEVACCQLAQWRGQLAGQDTLSISVNLSSKQFAQRDLLIEIGDVLRRHDLPAACLKLEITESAIMERAQEITDRLFELRALGVQLGLDDFGTGYSSLSYLHRFPLDTLKIDRSFIARMSETGHEGRENREIVRTIVALGKNLDMNVVAEGIEDANQLADLRELECNSGQGYFFARPLGAEEALELLESAPQW